VGARAEGAYDVRDHLRRWVDLVFRLRGELSEGRSERA
jgi:hypothetical protein